MGIFLNIVFGLIPTFALAWSVAGDERKPLQERVVAGQDDRRTQLRIFELIYGLWALTLAMWNWMRSAPLAWIGIWLVAGVIALGMPHALRASRRNQKREPS